MNRGGLDRALDRHARRWGPDLVRTTTELARAGHPLGVPLA
ncbi:hypothetical protein [Nannocystis punicea]|uniref:Uncharacterized protein n=1 Tax=Nannocystis punicea TaxID=2995304 RepID=A0ABY7GVD6_9BACT|nr:hypothetical protein [Nannocystis poenicansa]WAS90789.1 hypothetical protein O0S08_31765 [Nannocystis poenicansa]